MTINFLRASFAMFWIIPVMGWLVAVERNRQTRSRLRKLTPSALATREHAVARRESAALRWDTQARLDAETRLTERLAVEVITLRRALRDLERQRDRATAQTMYGNRKETNR